MIVFDRFDAEWWWILGALPGILFLCLLVLIAVVLLRRPRSPAAPGPSDAALDLLAQRYARGEIDRTEFLERRAVLLSREVRSPR